jgi:hypothetical protein
LFLCGRFHESQFQGLRTDGQYDDVARIEFQDKGWPAKGFEVQVNNIYKGDPRRTASLYEVKDNGEEVAQDNKWFTEDITVTIALQGHDAGSTVYYKNIRIKPLN